VNDMYCPYALSSRWAATNEAFFKCSPQCIAYRDGKCAVIDAAERQARALEALAESVVLDIAPAFKTRR